MEDSQKIPFNFTYYAMKLLGKNLYSNPWTAVSEIVANGIDAGANNVFVLIDIRDKERAVVEIFDDGTGMSYKDLREKYTLIGRNKRLEKDNVEGKTLGRKGIGKLAALYLSPCYYLYTKNDSGETAWVVDTRKIGDSDVPALIPTKYDINRLISQSVWSNLSTGTMIHLSDVDLKRIGPERLKSLPAILADYYLETVITSNISVCIISNEQDDIVFKRISKKINFDTMYGIFDNTGHGYKNRIQSEVFLTKDTVEQEVDYPRKTVQLDENKYTCDGVVRMPDLDGVMKELPYKMTGWVGIHSSLDNHILTRNSPAGKRIQHHPNALRLYVRGKLAVNNLMNYVASTAAFASYIEGEISFDVLDDDMFEDASTSNREGYSASDPRIKVLLEIVGKIITTLISERTKAGNKINEELKAIKEKKEAEAEAERKRREEAEQQAQAEREKAQRESMQRRHAEAERDTAKKRLFVLENNFTSDGEKYKHAMHLSVNFSKEIRGFLCDLETLNFQNREGLIDLMMAIDRSAAKIENLPKFVDSATFSLSSPKIQIDILQLIQQYIEAKGSNRLDYSFNIGYTVVKEIDFPEILMFVENVISNSIKAKASKLLISSCCVGGKCQIDFSDNGEGLHKKYLSNPQAIFELGETTTPEGFGIGAFHMKEIAKEMGGEIMAIPLESTGLTIRMVI